MPVCLSQNGPTEFVSDAPTDEVLVATVGGVYRLTRTDPVSWSSELLGLEGLHIHALMVEPSKNMIFAGVHRGTIYASKDGGTNWRVRDEGIKDKNIYSLNYQSANKIYAGTEPARLYVSDDLGETWNELAALRSVDGVSKWTFPAPPHVAHLKNVAFDPSDPQLIYACVEQGGLLRSLDGGASWEELHGFYEDVHRLLIRRSDPNWLYISGGEGIFHSRDRGETWENIRTDSIGIGYPDPFVKHPYQEDLMFIAGGGTNPRAWRDSHFADSKIARTRDAGRSWDILREGLPSRNRANIEAMIINVWDKGFCLVAGTTSGDVFYSEDEGDHWIKIAAGLPPISKWEHYKRLVEQ